MPFCCLCCELCCCAAVNALGAFFGIDKLAGLLPLISCLPLLSLLSCFNNLISKWLPAAFDLLQNASEKYNQMQVKKLTVPANSEATTKRAALGDLQNRGLNRVLATKDVANKE